MMKSTLIPDGFKLEEIEAKTLDSDYASMTSKCPQLKWRKLPNSRKEIVAKIEEAAAWIREEADAFTVLGIGTSAWSCLGSSGSTAPEL